MHLSFLKWSGTYVLPIWGKIEDLTVIGLWSLAFWITSAVSNVFAILNLYQPIRSESRNQGNQFSSPGFTNKWWHAFSLVNLKLLQLAFDFQTLPPTTPYNLPVSHVPMAMEIVHFRWICTSPWWQRQGSIFQWNVRHSQSDNNSIVSYINDMVRWYVYVLSSVSKNLY